jgi:hypothetical protein
MANQILFNTNVVELLNFLPTLDILSNIILCW